MVRPHLKAANVKLASSLKRMESGSVDARQLMAPHSFKAANVKLVSPSKGMESGVVNAQFIKPFFKTIVCNAQIYTWTVQHQVQPF